MKKLFVVLFTLIVSSGAMAQYHGGGHWGYGGGVRVGIVGGYGYYPYYYNPYYYPYPPPYYYGNGYYGYSNKLDIKISQIKDKYEYKISLVRNDKSLPHKQRRAEIKQLKYERKQAIAQAKADYYNKY